MHYESSEKLCELQTHGYPRLKVSIEELLKFFGKDLVDSVKEALAFDAAPKRAAEPDAGSKKRHRTV